MVQTLLRSLREQRNLSQRELADELGVSGDIISAWERGIRSPSRKNRIALKNFFKIQNADDLLEQDPATSSLVDFKSLPQCNTPVIT